MKKILIIFAISLILIGCSTQIKDDTADVLESNITHNMSEVLYKISEEASFETTFVVNRDYLEEKFSYELEDTIEVLGLFGSALDTNRVLLFKVDTLTNKAAVLAYLSHLQGELQATYPESMSTEKAMIDQAIILDSGNYVLFITGADAQKGCSYFDELN